MRSISLKYLMAVALAVFSLAAKRTLKLGPSEALSRIHAINQEEISAGKLAREKALSPEIKKFGDQLVQDHTRADQRLQELAKAENIDVTSAATQSMAGAKQAMKKTSTLGQLKMLSGARFDRAFVKAMEKGHTDAIHLLKSMDTSNSKVQSLIKSMMPELKAHRKTAENLKSVADRENKDM